jgi:DNA-binding transcriptional MerR regulator
MAWSGSKDGGSREYTPADLRRVLSAIEPCRGQNKGTSLNDLSVATRVGGRALRQILSDIDGSAFVIGFDGDNVFIAVTAEETYRMTNRLKSQAREMLNRAERREALAATLPRTQEALF